MDFETVLEDRIVNMCNQFNTFCAHALFLINANLLLYPPVLHWTYIYLNSFPWFMPTWVIALQFIHTISNSIIEHLLIFMWKYYHSI